MHCATSCKIRAPKDKNCGNESKIRTMCTNSPFSKSKCTLTTILRASLKLLNLCQAVSVANDCLSLSIIKLLVLTETM